MISLLSLTDQHTMRQVSISWTSKTGDLSHIRTEHFNINSQTEFGPIGVVHIWTAIQLNMSCKTSIYFVNYQHWPSAYRETHSDKDVWDSRTAITET